MLTESQEEMILIGALGLFWFGASPFTSSSPVLRAHTPSHKIREIRVCVCARALERRSETNFALAVLVAWRAISQQGSVGITDEVRLPAPAATTPVRGGARRPSGMTGRRRPWPCSPDDVYCVVEEWSYF